MSYDAWHAWRVGGVVPDRTQLLYKAPSDLSTTGPWGNWIRWLIGRYTGGSPRIFGLEICNEANALQLWPQQTAATGGTVADRFRPTSVNSHCTVGNLIFTASAISQGFGNPMWLMYPATADTPSNNRRLTPYDVFTNSIMDLMNSNGNRGNGSHIWTQHSYYDEEIAQDPPRSRVARTILDQRGFGGTPELWLTEGGYRFHLYAGKTIADQEGETTRAYNQIYQDGMRIGSFCNYGMITDPQPENDCGLNEYNGAPRTLYAKWAKWAPE
jgi:hypothetical protein